MGTKHALGSLVMVGDTPLPPRSSRAVPAPPHGILAVCHAALLWELHLGGSAPRGAPDRLLQQQFQRPAGLSRLVSTGWWGVGEQGRGRGWPSHLGGGRRRK